MLLNIETMRYFKIKNPFRKLRAMLREIDNYYYFLRQVELADDCGELKHYKLKRNEKHYVYGAINMPPELLLYNNEEDLAQLEKTFFGSEMTKLNDLFIKYNLIELYKIEFERIKDENYYAYVFNLKYKWQHCSTSSVITSILLTAGAVSGLVYLITALI